MDVKQFAKLINASVSLEKNIQETLNQLTVQFTDMRNQISEPLVSTDLLVLWSVVRINMQFNCLFKI